MVTSSRTSTWGVRSSSLNAATCDDPWVDLIPTLALYAPELLDPNTDLPLTTPTVDLWQVAICEASWALSVLSGGKIHPQECWVEDYQTRGNCRLTLRRSPVVAIDHIDVIRQCGREISPMLVTDWAMLSSQTINLCCGSTFGGDFYQGQERRRCGCNDEVVRAYYMVGSTLPPGTEAKVAWLAQQYVLAATGQKCSLPERVSNITRQGVSWTMLDPMEFLDRRFTGIGRIDSWLALVRMANPSAEFIDPLRSNRLFSRQVTCGASEGPVDYLGNAQSVSLSSTAFYLPLRWMAGDPQSLSFVVEGADWTGTWSAMVRERPLEAGVTPGPPLGTFSVTAVYSEPNTTFTLVMTEEDSLLIGPGQYAWDMQEEHGQTRLSGPVTVEPQVTTW